jgi:integrase
MGRETSPYIVGDFWLDKRRDGKSPEVWQIASYNADTRSISYRSTRCRSLADAKGKITAHFESARARGPQHPTEAKVIPLLFLYWEEHGKSVVSPAQIASSLRCFIGFLDQDPDTGLDLAVADITPNLFVRFRVWRMGPHSYDVPWGGKDYKHTSAKGVRGESVQRNLDDIRAALTHHADNGRIPYAPKVPAVPDQYRSQAKDRVLSMDELGAIVGFARGDIEMLRFVLLILSTAARPEAASQFDPREQWDEGRKLIDLHPRHWQRTKKVNPILPAIEDMAAILRAWSASNSTRVHSKRTAWRTLRRALGLGDEVVAKTIRHTVATYLRTNRVPTDEIETLLGHRVLKKTTGVYAKYDPDYLANAQGVLTTMFREVMAAANVWDAGHVRAKVGNGQTVVMRRDSPEAAAFLASRESEGD